MDRIKVEKHAGSPARFRVSYELEAASHVDAECAPPPAPVLRSARKVVFGSADTYTISGLTEEEMHILVALTGKCNTLGDVRADALYNALVDATTGRTVRAEALEDFGLSITLSRCKD